MCWLVLGSGEGMSSGESAEEHCALCAADSSIRIVRLGADQLDSMANAADRFNRSSLARIDTLLASRYFGEPDNDDAQQTAHRLARVMTTNSYRYLAHLTAESTFVYEADESTLTGLFARYSDVSLFCAARLLRVRIGMGRVCVKYDLSETGEGETVLGGKRMRLRVKDAKIRGQRRRVMCLDLPAEGSTVEVMFADHHSFAFAYRRSEGPPAPYEWFLVHDVRGAWLRKWGIHQPAAFMYWSTPLDGRFALPRDPLAGARLYIPRLRLKLPSIFPDINVDDLRNIEMPQPIFDMDYVRAGRYPAWIRADETLGFVAWEGVGELPPGIRERFPDQ
jgi:hypothetical protein